MKIVIVAALGCLLVGCVFFCRSEMAVQFPERCQGRAGSVHVAIIIPGLNTSPNAFNELTHVLCAHDIAPKVVELRQIDLSDPLEIWRGQVRQTVEDTRKEHPDAKISIIGYSLGGNLAIDFMASHGETIEALVLLAPAIKIRLFPRILLSLSSLLPFDVRIPSMAPIGYRATDYTPLINYQALYQLRQRIEKVAQLPERLLVAVRNNDSLISSFETRQWFEEKQPRAKFLLLHSANEPVPHSHLIIDRRSVGTSLWRDLVESIITTILGN